MVSPRLTCWIRRLALLELAVAALLFWVPRMFGQSAEVLGERVSSLSARLGALERVEADARLRVLESDMTEVKYLGRAVAAAVAAQLFLAMLGGREARRRG
jgi:hypothetical protein